MKTIMKEFIFCRGHHCVSQLAVLLVSLWIVPVVVFADEQTETQDSSNCGNYDITPAKEFGRLYREALAAKDYARLKELKQQKDNTDLWAKTQVECASGDNQETVATQEPSEESSNAETGPRIVKDDDGVRSADLECGELEGGDREDCQDKQDQCSVWIQENDEGGYAWLEHENMPACPCNVNDVIDDEPDWGYTAYSGVFGTGSIGIVNYSNHLVRKYHRGALGGCARSAPVDVGNPNRSAQQCCYGEINDSENSGQLITAGTGAGTPDIDAADSFNPLRDGHMASDVYPWEYCGAKIYNQIRKPNNGNNCPTNVQPNEE